MRKQLFQSSSKEKHFILVVSFLILTIAFSFAVYFNYSNYLAYPIFVLWIPVIILKQPSSFSKEERTFVKVSFVFLAIILLYWLIGYSSMEFGLLLRDVSWIMSGVIAIYAMKLFSERGLFVVYLIMLMALMFLMLLFLRDGRVLMEIDVLEASTVASAWYSSLYMLLSGLSLIVILNVKKMIPRIIAIMVLLASIYLNFFILQRGTTVIITIVEISLIFVFLIKRRSMIIILSIIIVVVAIIALSIDNMINILDWLAEVSPSERLSKRFDEMSIVLTYENMDAGGGSFSARNDLMGVSWNSFTSSFSNFLFGIGEHTGSDILIGHHSFFIDTLARYGIVGGVIVTTYFVKQYKIFMSVLDKNTEWALYMQCAIVFLIYVFRNFYGQLAYSLTNLVMLVFFPLTFQIIRHYNHNN